MSNQNSAAATETADDEKVLRDVLDRWRSAVDAYELEQVAAVFTDNAIFQGLLNRSGIGPDSRVGVSTAVLAG